MPQTVLIVDDDEDIRHVLRVMFETEGYLVVAEAADGANGLALALRHQPAFIVLDEMMPRMTGEETALQLRAMLPDTRIVAFSGVIQQKPRWADGFLNKQRIAEIAPLLAKVADA